MIRPEQVATHDRTLAWQREAEPQGQIIPGRAWNEQSLERNSFPGSAWERTVFEAPPPRLLLTDELDG